MSVQSKIQEAATQNAQLLAGLHETDGAPAQLHQQKSYINDLDAQITQITKRVATLKQSTQKELKDHEKYRDSTLRRFAHKASGQSEKFATKAAKEEKEYFDAINAQKTAEDELAYTQQLKAEAEQHRNSIQTHADRHNTLQSQLDALYNSIFAGPTPSFPSEDAAEQSCNIAQMHLSNLTQTLEAQKHALFLLGKIAQKLTEARDHLDKAHSMSQWDLMGGGTMASMQKQNLLQSAGNAIQAVRGLHEQVKQIAPEVPDLVGDVQIKVGSIWSDVVFDNMFTDMKMHEQVKASMGQVDSAGRTCGELIREREGRLNGLQGEVERASGELRQRRIELQRVREETFSRVLGGGEGNMSSGQGAPEYAPPAGAPPGYSA